MIEIAVIGSADELPPFETVKVAVPLATVLSKLVKTAVIVVVPLPTAVARPVLLIVATVELLEVHATVEVRSSVAPAPVVPIAMNWPVSVGESTVWLAGMIEIDVTSVFVGPVEVVVTVACALEVTGPVKPLMLAVIGTLPAPTDVTNPEELTVATFELPVLQVTRVVTSSVVAG
jgi:hypothetical protein